MRDHGPGIDQESQQKIFQVYERGKSSNMSGLGLGLYISKSIIEAHRGSMSLESKPEMGSKFTICLPLEIH